ncbi:Hemicentin-1 [Mactra antiquata]
MGINRRVRKIKKYHWPTLVANVRIFRILMLQIDLVILDTARYNECISSITLLDFLFSVFFTVLVLNLIITSSASECIDNDKYDCEGLNALIDICNDTQKAINVCPEFCGLCHLVDVDGGWGSWSEWTHCSVTCEQGIIERHRTCSNPMPANDGLNCTGNFFESKECFTAAPCPVNGNWSEWSQWDSCSTSCEAGIQSRTRSCTNPKPDSLGDYCSGPNFDAKLCDNGPCSGII